MFSQIINISKKFGLSTKKWWMVSALAISRQVTKRGLSTRICYTSGITNKPVIDLRSGRGFITSQNHGVAVDEKGLEASGFKPMFRNADDDNNEGIYHPEKPLFAVQFHPEAYPGPEDTTYLFDDFMKNMGFENQYKNTHPQEAYK